MGKRVKENVAKSPLRTVRMKSLTFQVAPFLGRPSGIPPFHSFKPPTPGGTAMHQDSREGLLGRSGGSRDDLLWGQHMLANLGVSA